MWRCILSGEQWNDSVVTPWSPWLKTSLNHHLWDQAEVSVFVFILYNSHHSVHSDVLDIGPSRERYPASWVVCQDITADSLLSIVSCHLRGQIGTCVLGHPAREGKLVGWLETSVLRGRSQPFWWKKWLTVNVRSLGRHGHREVGERVGESQNGKRHARMGTTNKVIQTVSPSELWRKKGMWGGRRHAVIKNDEP